MAQRITDELGVLTGQPIADCWRVADMQVFEFGPRRTITNRDGQAIEAAELRLHVQCPWRIVSGDRILFGSDDLHFPADDQTSLNEFDWDRDDSVLDVAQRAWFAERRTNSLGVVRVRGDAHGGVRIEMAADVVLEILPCDSGARHEYWRLLGHRPDGSHFVVTAQGGECDGAGSG